MKFIKTAGVCAVVALGVGATSATAGSLITSAKIKDGAVHMRDLSPGLQAKINQAGKPGANGATGAAGANGVNGATGANGDTGAAGANGVDGATGTQGETGATGAKGDKGDTGAKGDRGYKGDKGDTGAKGDKGDTGDKGDKGDTGANGRDGTGLPADFHVSNKSVGLTSQGIVFGPYAKGGEQGGSVIYRTNGLKLSDLTHLAYQASWNNVEKNDVGVPYLRLFLANGATVIFSPNTQPVKETEAGVLHTWDVTKGTVRYDDDAGFGSDVSWDSVVAEYGEKEIESVAVSVGYSAGTDLTGTLRSLEVNNHSWKFGA